MKCKKMLNLNEVILPNIPSNFDKKLYFDFYNNNNNTTTNKLLIIRIFIITLNDSKCN